MCNLLRTQSSCSGNTGTIEQSSVANGLCMQRAKSGFGHPGSFLGMSSYASAPYTELYSCWVNLEMVSDIAVGALAGAAATAVLQKLLAGGLPGRKSGCR